jgi:hypothetical protein
LIGFRAGIACSTEAVPIRINLIAPPLYVITTSTPEKTDGLQILNDACKAIEERICEAGGSFNIQMAPKVVTATDEADLAKQMEKAELENAEVLVPFLILTDSLPPHKITSRCPVMTTTTTKNKLEWAERSRKEKTIRRTRKAKAVIEEHDPATIFLLFVLLNLREFHDYDDRRRSKHYSSSKNVGHRFFFI